MPTWKPATYVFLGWVDDRGNWHDGNPIGYTWKNLQTHAPGFARASRMQSYVFRRKTWVKKVLCVHHGDATIRYYPNLDTALVAVALRN